MKTTRNLLIAIDIGNSRVSYGAYLGGKLLGIWHTDNDTIPNIANLLNKSGVNKNNIRCIITSVVPQNATKVLKSITRIIPRRSAYIVGKDVFPVVKMKYNRRNLGSDRLVNIYGAVKRYKLPVLIADFGTAVTFDYVSKSGVFEGGVIISGPQTALWALGKKTALLPKLGEMKNVKRLAGRNTKEAMHSGVLNGYGALADGLIGRFKEQYGRTLKVLATGGFAAKVAPYTRKFDYLDPLHTIKSLVLIYQNEIKPAGWQAGRRANEKAK